MIMKLVEYQKLPYYMDIAEVEKYCFMILQEASLDIRSDTISKLREMCNRQWHTYTLPSSDLQVALKELLIQNWVSNTEGYLETAMVISYNFGLDKAFFAKALSLYSGRHKTQFQHDLEMSHGDNMDPWWSMKKDSNIK